MKNKKIILLSFLPLLVSCSKTNELYSKGAYDTGNFETNYYLEHNNVDKIDIKSSESFDASKVTFISNPTFGKKLDGLIDDDQCVVTLDENGNEQKSQLEWNLDTPHSDKNIGYGPTKNLTSIDESFSYGFLSRLYDGRVRCDGYYAQSRVQINKTGYSTYFPKELKSARYFAVALRGQTSCKGYSNEIADVDVTLKFYKHNVNEKACEEYVVTSKNVQIPTNTGGYSSLMLFYFIDVFGLQYQNYLDGIVAMSMSFSLNSLSGSDEDKLTYGVPVDDMADQNNPHFALMLYEVMLPDSIWL